MEGEFDDINTWSRDRKCHQGLFVGSYHSRTFGSLNRWHFLKILAFVWLSHHSFVYRLSYHSSGKFEFNSNNSDRLVDCTLVSNQLNSRLLPNANYMMKLSRKLQPGRKRTGISPFTLIEDRKKQKSQRW